MRACSSATLVNAEANASASMSPMLSRIRRWSLFCSASKKNLFQRFTAMAAARFSSRQAMSPSANKVALRRVGPVQKPKERLAKWRRAARGPREG